LKLPYLHWETYEAWKNRQQLIAEMKKTKKNEPYSNLPGSKHVSEIYTKRSEVLLHKHLLRADPLEPPPLHDRRTLEQSYFYNLRNVAHRDSDQIIGQSTKRKEEKQPDQCRKMMMVDQLWMWAVDGNTIITAFPETGTGNNSDGDVLTGLIKHIPRAIQQGLTSMNGLISLIVDHCTGVFHHSDINPDIAFFEFFADDIGAAKDELDNMSRRFRETSSNVESMWSNDKVTPGDMSRELDKLFTIKQEIELVAKVENILADLNKIDFLYSQQEDVITSLVKISKSSRSLTDLRETIQHRRNAWSGMAITAKAIYDSLRDLLDLKQRQANVSEARTARYQIEISARHGRSVLLFTVITIIFLPMSVIATMLGMNVTELNGQNNLRMWLASLLLFPPSLAIAMVSLALAFGWRRVYLWTLEVTGLKRQAPEGETRQAIKAEEGG
jgi:Mg2+ and Co2+ transporter CorA